MDDRPVLPWLVGGLLLGSLLLVAVFAVQPLGVSTQYVRACGGVAEILSPGCADQVSYFKEEKIVFGYAEMVVIGIPIGALLSALAFRRFRARSVPEVWAARFGASKPARFAAAALGGALLLFGARLAGGCTSGHILSGVSQLAVSSILFFVTAFGAAAFVAQLLYRKPVRS